MKRALARSTVLPAALPIWLLMAVLAAGCSSVPQTHTPGQVSRLPAAQALPAPPPGMTLDDIIALQRQGAAAPVIVDRLNETNSSFRLSTADVLRLNRAKVPDSVVDFILNKERSAAQEACAGELARRDRELQSRLMQRDQDWGLRCGPLYQPFGSPFYSPFFPHRFYWR